MTGFQIESIQVPSKFRKNIIRPVQTQVVRRLETMLALMTADTNHAITMQSYECEMIEKGSLDQVQHMKIFIK